MLFSGLTLSWQLRTKSFLPIHLISTSQRSGRSGSEGSSASGLLQNSQEKSEETQVNTLIYTMGDEADDILRSFKLEEADGKKYSTVKEKFETFFVKRRNVIYERARFNMRRQEEGESVAAFINDLYVLVEHCEYGPLQDEMVRDRLVVGLRDSKLSEKLQLDPKLTLDSAITMTRQSESVHMQQTQLRKDEDGKDK